MTRDCCDRTGRRRRRLCRTLGRWGSSGLADVIELILDKGLVIDVFVRVSLVGIELLTIDARIVVASVDTFLRFAEATHRLDLYGKGKGRAGLPDVVQGMTESGSKGKTTGVLEGVLEPAPKPAGPSSAALFQQVVAPALASASAGEIAEAADIFLRGVGADTYRELIRARLGDNAYQQLVRDAEFFFDDELRAAHEWQIDDATHITAPTLLVHGRESQRYTRAFAETVERLAQMLPAADVLEIPGLSHAKPLEDPPAIARLIAKTVNQRTGRRP